MAVPGSVRNLPNMLEETYDLVSQVPRGMVTTYGEVARALGDIVASRYVGLAMSLNDDIVRVPCRRVVRSDGSLGGYTGGGSEKKAKLLKEEGVEVHGGKVVDFESILFKDFRSRHPLTELRKRQIELKASLSLRDRVRGAERVAGVDVAYDDDHAFAALVIFDIGSGNEVERRVIEGDASFPYIPTYLAFREIPVIAPLMKSVDDKTIVMYDGNGVLHPEGFGIASQVGVAFGIPTIGVAKKLLCGEVLPGDSPNRRSVRFGGKLVGYAMSARGSTSPVYVSIGHMVSLRTASSISKMFLKHRIPEPTRQAHIVAESARRGTNHK
jgi:deoxyribonuclease V